MLSSKTTFSNVLLSGTFLWFLWIINLNGFFPTLSLTIFSIVTYILLTVVISIALITFIANFSLGIRDLCIGIYSHLCSRNKSTIPSISSENLSKTIISEPSLSTTANFAQSKILNAISPIPKSRTIRNEQESSSSSSSSSMYQSNIFNPENSSLYGKTSTQTQSSSSSSFPTLFDSNLNTRRPFDTPARSNGISFAFNESTAPAAPPPPPPPPPPSSSLRRRRGSGSAMELSTPYSTVKPPRQPISRVGAPNFGAVDVSDLNTSGFGFVVAPGFDDGIQSERVYGGSGWTRGGVRGEVRGGQGARDLGLDRASLASTVWESNESRLRERITIAQDDELRRDARLESSFSSNLLKKQQSGQQYHQQHHLGGQSTGLTFDMYGGEVHDTGRGYGAWRTKSNLEEGRGGRGLSSDHEYLDGFKTSTSSSSSYSSNNYTSLQSQSQMSTRFRGGGEGGGGYSQAEHSSASELRFEIKAAELPRRAYFNGLGAGVTAGEGNTSPKSPLGFDSTGRDISSLIQHSSFQDLRSQSTALFKFIQWHIKYYYLPWLQKNADDILSAPKPVTGLVHDYSLPFLLREPGDDSFWKKTQQKFSALGIGYGGLNSTGGGALSLSQSFPLRVVKRKVLPEPQHPHTTAQTAATTATQQPNQSPQPTPPLMFQPPAAFPNPFPQQPQPHLQNTVQTSTSLTHEDLVDKLLREAHAAAAKYGLAPMSLDTLIQNMVFMDETALEVQGPIRKEKKEEVAPPPIQNQIFGPPPKQPLPGQPPHTSAWYVRIVDGRKSINKKLTNGVRGIGIGLGKDQGLEISPRKSVHLFQEKADLEAFLWGGPGLSNSAAAAAAALGSEAFDLRGYVLWRLRELVNDNSALSITNPNHDDDSIRPLADFMGDQVGLSSIKGASLGISISSSFSSSFGGLGFKNLAPFSDKLGINNTTNTKNNTTGFTEGATQQQLALLPSDAQIIFHYFVTMIDDLVAQRLRTNDSVRMQERILYGRALNHSASDHHGIGVGFSDSTKTPTVTDRIASSVFVSYGDSVQSRVDGGLLSFNRNDGVGGSSLFSLGQAVRGHEPTRHASLRFRLNCRSEGGSEGGKFDAVVQIDGRPVLTTDPQDIGHGAKISLPRSIALWAQMQASQANGELAIHRNCIVNIKEELMSMCGML